MAVSCVGEGALYEGGGMEGREVGKAVEVSVKAVGKWEAEKMNLSMSKPLQVSACVASGRYNSSSGGRRALRVHPMQAGKAQEGRGMEAWRCVGGRRHRAGYGSAGRSVTASGAGQRVMP